MWGRDPEGEEFKPLLVPKKKYAVALKKQRGRGCRRLFLSVASGLSPELE